MTADQASTGDPRRRYADRPLVDDDTDGVLDAATHQLILLRSPMWHGDAGALLHALASLQAQITAWMADAVADARDQTYSWAEIADLLGVNPTRVHRRYAQHARRRQPIDID